MLRVMWKVNWIGRDVDWVVSDSLKALKRVGFYSLECGHSGSPARPCG